MTNIKYPAARTQRVIHAAPQFRPIRRGVRRTGLVRVYECKNGEKVTIRIFEELDIADQDVLLCLLAMARAEKRGAIISPDPQSIDNQALRKALEMDGYAATQNVIVIQATIYELLVELGRATDQRSYDWLRKSIIRLSLVSFVYECAQGWWTFNLLSARGVHMGSNEKVSVCINPLSARAVLGDGGYTLVHRGERVELKTGEAKALHSVLCGLVDMGTERVLSVDMLANKVYSRYDEIIDKNAIRRRRKNIIAASKELNALGYWSCFAIGRGSKTSFKIKRKKRSQIRDNTHDLS
jgi:hypothetical protein